MRKYLGEEVLDVHKTVYAMYTPQDWVLVWIKKYGGIDGGHHKDWLLDQIVRILNGTKVNICVAKWDDGTEELRATLDEPSNEYKTWVLTLGDEYNIGIAP